MKIALINGSPKKKGSASQTLLKELSVYLPEDTKSSNYQLIHPEVSKETAEALVDFDVLVFAFPLYVDGVPSHLLACLQQLEKAGLKRETRVYCIVNSGFYEGEQNEYAVQVVRNWCARVGLIWGMGIGYGGGGALTHLQGCPPGNGPGESGGAG